MIDMHRRHQSRSEVRQIAAKPTEYVWETFRFTGQEKVFGIRTRGVAPKTPHSLCNRHGIGLKITVQVPKAQYGFGAGTRASSEVDPDLIADLAPKLNELLNAQNAARHLGASVAVARGLVGDGCWSRIAASTTGWSGFRQRRSNPSLRTGAVQAGRLHIGGQPAPHPDRRLREQGEGFATGGSED